MGGQQRQYDGDLSMVHPSNGFGLSIGPPHVGNVVKVTFVINPDCGQPGLVHHRGHAELPRRGSVSNYWTYFVRLGPTYQMRNALKIVPHTAASVVLHKSVA